MKHIWQAQPGNGGETFLAGRGANPCTARIWLGTGLCPGQQEGLRVFHPAGAANNKGEQGE